MNDNGRVRTVPEVRDALERAAETLRQLPAEQWPGWIVYLLEALDCGGYATSSEWLHVLAGVSDGIRVRVECGRW